MQIWLGSINLFWKPLWNVLRALTIQADLICLEKVSETTCKYSVLTQIYKLPNEINQLFFRGCGSWEAIKVDGQESQHTVSECWSARHFISKPGGRFTATNLLLSSSFSPSDVWMSATQKVFIYGKTFTIFL